MSFLVSPFSTAVGQRIEQATGEYADENNLALNLEICDLINDTEDGPKDAVKALRRRLFNNKNWRLVLHALAVLEMCIKNCGPKLYLFVGHKDFANPFSNLASSKTNAPTVVRDRVLGLLQEWSSAFRLEPAMEGICNAFDKLRASGVEFPPRGEAELVPIITPHRAVPEAGTAPPANNAQASLQHSHTTAPPVQSASAGGASAVTGEALVPSSQQMAKLQSELDIVKTNITVLLQLLEQSNPGEEHPSDFELLRDLNQTCRAMQARIVELIERVARDDLICNLLTINDHMNTIFERYDRYMSRRDAVLASQPQTGSLIDLGDGAGASTAPAESLNSQLIGLSLSGGAAAASSVPQPQGTTLTAQAVHSQDSPDGGDEDEFAAFAQSRQAVSSPSPQVLQPRPAVESIGETSSRLPPAASVRPQMQQAQAQTPQQLGMSTWPNDQLHMHSGSPNTTHIGRTSPEGTTSEEFNAFLAERAAKDPSASPDLHGYRRTSIPVNTSGSKPGESLLPPYAARSRPRPAMQLEDEQDSLFGL